MYMCVCIYTYIYTHISSPGGALRVPRSLPTAPPNITTATTTTTTTDSIIIIITVISKSCRCDLLPPLLVLDRRPLPLL